MLALPKEGTAARQALDLVIERPGKKSMGYHAALELSGVRYGSTKIGSLIRSGHLEKVPEDVGKTQGYRVRPSAALIEFLRSKKNGRVNTINAMEDLYRFQRKRIEALSKYAPEDANAAINSAAMILHSLHGMKIASASVILMEAD